MLRRISLVLTKHVTLKRVSYSPLPSRLSHIPAPAVKHSLPGNTATQGTVLSTQGTVLCVRVSRPSCAQRTVPCVPKQCFFLLKAPLPRHRGPGKKGNMRSCPHRSERQIRRIRRKPRVNMTSRKARPRRSPGNNEPNNTVLFKAAGKNCLRSLGIDGQHAVPEP